MPDQAEGLRRLVRDRDAHPGDSAGDAPRRARSLLLTSGKGGVGTSNVALNLALALGEMGRSVLLVDADLGLANLDLLCGLSPARDLGDVLTGDATPAEALAEGPFGVRLLAGAHAVRTPAGALRGAAARLAAALAALDRAAEFLIIDAGSGLNAGVLALSAAADEVAVVTTPEPTALADSHAAVAGLRRLPGVRLRVLVNQARSPSEARDVLDRLSGSCRDFLGAPVTPLGHVGHDPRVAAAVRSRTPFLLSSPRGVASRGVRRLARAWAREADGPAHSDFVSRSVAGPHGPGFFSALSARWSRRPPTGPRGGGVTMGP